MSALLGNMKEKSSAILRNSPKLTKKQMKHLQSSSRKGEEDRDANISKVNFDLQDLKKNYKEMSKETRLLEKLKFFHLEDERIQSERKMIQRKSSSMSTRFGPRESNMGMKSIVGDVSKQFENPF